MTSHSSNRNLMKSSPNQRGRSKHKVLRMSTPRTPQRTTISSFSSKALIYLRPSSRRRPTWLLQPQIQDPDQPQSLRTLTRDPKSSNSNPPKASSSKPIAFSATISGKVTNLNRQTSLWTGIRLVTKTRAWQKPTLLDYQMSHLNSTRQLRETPQAPSRFSLTIQL